jgi:hypothetical protein
MANQLLTTIQTDLAAGVSYLEAEAEGAGLALWNIFKGAFIALEPAEAAILTTVLGDAVAAAGTGASIEQIETQALNTTKTDEQAVLAKAGSGIIQTVIAGIRANPPAA